MHSQTVSQILAAQHQHATLHNLEQILMLGVDKREVQRMNVSAANYPGLLSNYVETVTVVEPQPSAGPVFIGQEQPQ